MVDVSVSGSHFPSFGIADPITLGMAVSDRRGRFELVAAGAYRREQIDVNFSGRSNLDATAQDYRVIEVTATPAAPTPRSGAPALRPGC